MQIRRSCYVSPYADSHWRMSKTDSNDVLTIGKEAGMHDRLNSVARFSPLGPGAYENLRGRANIGDDVHTLPIVKNGNNFFRLTWLTLPIG